MGAGWLILAALAASPVSIAFVLGISVVAHALPSHYPDWVRRVVAGHGRSADEIAVPSLALLFVPLVCWSTALLLSRRSQRIRIEHADTSDTDRISFVEPLIADGLLGSPEALLYPDADEFGPERAPPDSCFRAVLVDRRRLPNDGSRRLTPISQPQRLVRDDRLCQETDPRNSCRNPTPAKRQLTP